MAILSSNPNLLEEEIARQYGIRWNIEVFFKIAKTYLRLAKEIQSRRFDALIAHTTIVMIRYIFLSYQQRMSADDRSLGDLFFYCVDEIKEITLREALIRIVGLVLSNGKRFYEDGENELMEMLIKEIMNKALYLLTKSSKINSES